jgi:excisionase family DNA binding protein
VSGRDVSVDGESVVAVDPFVALSLDEPLLDVEQAAALLNVRPSWVRDATRAGRLPCIRVGRHLRFTRPMLEQWAAQHRIENAATGGRFARRAGRAS